MAQFGPINIAVENIAIGLLAAGIVGLLSYMKTYIKNKIVERQYPIAGEYISIFIDEVDGERVRQAAPVSITQTGRNITGKTRLANSDRVWILNGDVSENGYLNGTYRALNPHDRGVGNFFLYIEPDGTMRGMWSGYDEVNDKINSGKYIFYPKIEGTTVRSLHEDEIPAVITLLNDQLGRDYISAELIEESISDDSDVFTLVALTSNDTTDYKHTALRTVERIVDAVTETPLSRDDSKDVSIIGACIGMVASASDVSKYLNKDVSELPEGFRHAKEIGVIRTVAVAQDYRERGVGTELIQQCIEECLDRRANILCSLGWKVEGSVNIGGILDKEGFERVAELNEHWHEESLEQGYHCPNCGEPPCSCSAILFVKYDDPVTPAIHQ